MKLGAAAGAGRLPVSLLGAGIVILAPVLIAARRPLAKSLVKGSLVIGRKARSFMERVEEGLSDIVAEARAELEQQPNFPEEDTEQDERRSPGREERAEF